MPEAKLSDDEYQQTLRRAIRDILATVFAAEPGRASEFLQQIADIGAEALNAKCCSIFLRDEDDPSTLRIRAANPGDMGEELMKAGAKYHIPDRKAFANKKVRERETKDCLKIWEADEGRWRDVLTRLVESNKLDRKYERFEDRNELIDALVDDGRLPMGVTACVVRSRKPECLKLSQVRDHPEWRGAYEAVQGELCTSIVEVPLLLGSKTPGLIKIENHDGNDPVRSYDVLIRAEKEDSLSWFGSQHLRMLEILADCVVHVYMQIMEETRSYRLLASSTLLDQVAGLRNERLLGRANKRVAALLAEFCSEKNTWDLRGVARIYEGIVGCLTRTMEILGLRSRYGWVVDRLQSSETLLRIDTNYRDHFIHQFQVFLLGYCILNRQAHVRETLLTYLEKAGARHKGHATMDDVVRCWLLTSLYHDVAYSLELYDVWLGEQFGELFRARSVERTELSQHADLGLAIPWGNLLGFNEAAPAGYITRIGRLIYERIGGGSEERSEGIARELMRALIEQQNHGVLGGLVLMHSRRAAGGEDREHERIVVEEAATAITLHTSAVGDGMRSVIQSMLDPAKLPFGFLLAYCDGVQDWGRPMVAGLYRNETVGSELRVMLHDLDVDDSGAHVELVHSDFPDVEWRQQMERAKAIWASSPKMPCSWSRSVGTGAPFLEAWDWGYQRAEPPPKASRKRRRGDASAQDA